MLHVFDDDALDIDIVDDRTEYQQLVQSFREKTNANCVMSTDVDGDGDGDGRLVMASWDGDP